MRLLIRLTFTAAALWVAVELVPGIRYEGHWAGLLVVALIFGIVNAIVRPILLLLTCPLVLLTLGLFVFVVNGLLLMLTGGIAGRFGVTFAVSGLWAGLLGAIVVSVVSTVPSVFVSDGD